MRCLILVATLLAASCSAPGASTGPQKGSIAVSFSLSSPAFEDGAQIPTEYTCDAGSKQLPLEWSGAPQGTVEFALTMDDPDANGFVHWVVTGIPADATSIGASLPEGASSGQPYRGPCPPSGTHHYVLTLYALPASLGGTEATTSDQVRAAAAGKTLATAVLTGTYKRGASS